MRSPTSSTLVRRGLLAMAAASLAAAIFAGLLTTTATAERRRSPPPLPSTTPFVDAEAERQLQAAIGAYQRIVAQGGWPAIPGRVTLRPGDSSADVATLRRRLETTGDIGPARSDPYTFDSGLEQAVKNYQTRNGLEPTGIVYGITQRVLNVPAETRLKQLELNLTRLRELKPALAKGRRHIVMNAASFELQAISDGRVEVVSRTIAGKRSTPTPNVSAQVRAINILPYWHVPGTIAKAQLIPAMRKNPSYLYKERIRVFSTFGGEEVDPSTINWFGPEAERFVFRQDPGPHNALGLLRFDMPNKHIVYMHDTPMKQLFGFHERAYSAGCVRIENFVALADWIVAGHEGWNADRIEAAMASNTPQAIKLREPIPVHFIYLTAWVDNGVVHFRNDLYNRDGSAFDGGEDRSQRAIGVSLAP